MGGADRGKVPDTSCRSLVRRAEDGASDKNEAATQGFVKAFQYGSVYETFDMQRAVKIGGQIWRSRVVKRDPSLESRTCSFAGKTPTVQKQDTTTHRGADSV